MLNKYTLPNHWPPKPRFLEVFRVNNRVFRWPKPLFFMVLGAHGSLTWKLKMMVPERNLLFQGA